MSEGQSLPFWKNLLPRRNKQPVPILTEDKEDPYTDNPNLVEERVVSAKRQLEKLEEDNEPPTGILEIGTGFGGVTQALQQLHPDIPIIGVDIDQNPRIKEAAQANGISFFQEDMTTISPQRLQELLTRQKQPINTIVALRTSGAVARHMNKILDSSDFRGNFLFSFIGLDNDASDAFDWMIQSQQIQGTSIPFWSNTELRSIERGFSIHYEPSNPEASQTLLP